MKRFWHYLKANLKSETLSSFVCFDTETTPEKLPDGRERDTLSFGWGVYQRRDKRERWRKPQWRRFSVKEDFWQWVDSLSRDKTALYLFCHNTSYDLPVLDAFHQLVSLGWDIKFAVLDAPPTIVKLRKGKRTLWLLDTLNFFRVPLAQLGKMIGLDKLDMPEGPHTAEEWDKYCKRDVEILRRALIYWADFLVDEDLGNFKTTKAAQSMAAFRHRFMDHRILIHCHPETLAMERESYHGGRCEAFYLGKKSGKFYVLDVNSMYPYVMYENLYPTKFLFYKDRFPLERLSLLHPTRGVTADVTLVTAEPVYGLNHAGKLVFPIGEFRTVLTTRELHYAQERGHVKEVHRLALYHQEPLFRRFVGELYEKKRAARQSGNKPLEEHFKRLLNSFYGKWGQSGRVWEKDSLIEDRTCKVWYEYDWDTKTRKTFRQFAGVVQHFKDEADSPESFCAIAAHITADARLYLWDLVNKAGREHVMYLDTDSLVVDDDGLHALSEHLNDEHLGDLKVEVECDDLEIWGCKDYRFGVLEKHKGVRKNAVWLDESTIEQTQWSSLTGLLRKGDMTAPERKQVTKHLSRLYDKGVKESTNVVTPLRMPSAT